MHSRRLASLLIGAWLAASIFMDFVAIQNFHSVDRFLSAPSAVAADQIRTMGGKAEARTLLRYHAADLNRFLFEQWEYAQLVLGVLTVAVFVFGHGEPPRIALAATALMIVIVAAERFYLTPEITRWGGLLDVPNTPGAVSIHFWRLHGIYSGAELIKIGLCLVASASLLVRRVDRKRFVRQHEGSSRQSGARTTATTRMS